jgi:hypothetical protein
MYRSYEKRVNKLPTEAEIKEMSKEEREKWLLNDLDK